VKGAAADGERNQGLVRSEHRRARSGEDFDIIIGFLGFWALVLLAVTVWMEVTAQPALGWALGLLALLAVIYGMVRLRRRLPARTATRKN
jgi:cadmium resistance protein CadD (predicted permease)